LKLGEDTPDYDPIVYFNLGFGSYDGDNFIAFGYNEEEAPLTQVGSTTLDSDRDKWSLDVEDTTYGDYNDEMNVGSAKLATSFPYIAVPQAIFDELQKDLITLGFSCNVNKLTGATLCVTTEDCDEVVGQI